MATCIRCGRKGLFFKVDANGRCESCASAYKQERSSKPKSEPIVHKPKSPLASVFDLKRPGQTLRYKYTDVKVHCPVIYPAPILRIGQICGMIRSESDKDLISIVFMPENDPDGDFILLGFLPEGKLAGMAADWFDREWTAWAQVVEVTSDDIYLDVAFWIPDGER